jgi:tungstate transport system substrate-binding protein
MVRPWVVLACTAALLPACAGGGDTLVLGATTSLQDTGILDELVAAFESQTGYEVTSVTPLVAGSGQVLELARRGEVDVVITHSPGAEQQLIDSQDGIDRRPVMQNYFLVAGPADDPADARSATTLAEAFRRIAEAGRSFISRGDRSGTHARELATWDEAGVDPSGEPWYQESAAGQGQTLALASDRAAYTLVDSSTFAVFQERLSLQALVTDREHPNVYSVVRVNPGKHDGVNAGAAEAFTGWVTSAAAQELIAEFGRDRYGEPLFESAGE